MDDTDLPLRFKGEVPDDEIEATKIRCVVINYLITDEALYQKG